MASCSIEEVAASTAAPKLFQLYIFRDRGVTRDLLMRAKAAGYAGLVLAIDVPVPANRERDRRTGMTIPPRFSLRSMLAFARHPLWCWNILRRRPVKLANRLEVHTSELQSLMRLSSAVVCLKQNTYILLRHI